MADYPKGKQKAEMPAPGAKRSRDEDVTEIQDVIQPQPKKVRKKCVGNSNFKVLQFVFTCALRFCKRCVMFVLDV